MTALADLTPEEIDVLKTQMAAIRIVHDVSGEYIDLAVAPDAPLVQVVASNMIAGALNTVVMTELDTMAKAIGLDLEGDPKTHLKQVMDHLTDGNRRQGATR